MTSLTLKDVERRLDLAFAPERPDDPWWLVEAVGYDDPRVERRLYAKAVRVAEDHDLWGRLRSGVIYVREALSAKVLPPCLGPPGHPNDLLPVRVFLDRLSPRQLLRLSPELFPLLPLSRVARQGLQEHLARWWRWASSRLGDRSSEGLEQQRDLLCRFYLARFPEAILKAVRRDLEKIMSIEQTRAGQELIQIGEERGLQIGEERGIQIGEQRGEQRALVGSIRRFLSFRFGPLPGDLVQRLEGVESLDRLRVLQDRALEAADLESFSREL